MCMEAIWWKRSTKENVFHFPPEKREKENENVKGRDRKNSFPYCGDLRLKAAGRVCSKNFGKHQNKWKAH